MSLNKKNDTFECVYERMQKSNDKYFSHKDFVYEMNGSVLLRTNEKIFDFHGVVIDDVLDHCKKQGFKEIDKIVFASCYSIDICEFPKKKLKMKGDSKIKIIKEKGKYIAIVCMYDYVEIE